MKIHSILKRLHHLGTDMYGMLPWQFSNFTCEIIDDEISHQSEGVNNHLSLIILEHESNVFTR